MSKISDDDKNLKRINSNNSKGRISNKTIKNSFKTKIDVTFHNLNGFFTPKSFVEIID